MGPRGGGGALDDPAQFLLAHTGEFNLTDAQVTRLAGIARRSAERRPVHAHADGLDAAAVQSRRRPSRLGRPRADASTMQQRFEQMRPAMQNAARPVARPIVVTRSRC